MTGRRKSSDDSVRRTLLLDAAQQVMLEHGYAAVTTRRVGQVAGVAPPLIHYYFETMDDLFVALFRRAAQAGSERISGVLSSVSSVRELWALSVESGDWEELTLEFLALGNHRPAIREEILTYARLFREQQAAVLADLLKAQGAEDLPPTGVAVILTAVSRSLALERALGMVDGHAEALDIVDRWLDALERRSP